MEQQQSLFVAFIDLTKALDHVDVVNRGGIFEVLANMLPTNTPQHCKVLSQDRSLQFIDLMGSVVFEGSTLEAFVTSEIA